jgi:hypothetical protein
MYCEKVSIILKAVIGEGVGACEDEGSRVRDRKKNIQNFPRKEGDSGNARAVKNCVRTFMLTIFETVTV